MLLNSGAFSRLALFQKDELALLLDLYINFLQGLKKTVLYWLCKEYNFVPIYGVLLPLKLHPSFDTQLWNIYGYPVVDLQLSVLSKGHIEFYLKPTRQTVYRLSEVDNLVKKLDTVIRLAPTGCLATLTSVHANASAQTVDALKHRYGFSLTTTSKWVGVTLESSALEFSWPLELCFLETSALRMNDDSLSSNLTDLNNLVLPSNVVNNKKELTEFANEEAEASDKRKEGFTEKEETADAVVTLVPSHSSSPVNYSINSAKSTPASIKVNEEILVADHNVSDDILMEEIDDVGITEADFDYFDLPNVEEKVEMIEPNFANTLTTLDNEEINTSISQSNTSPNLNTHENIPKQMEIQSDDRMVTEDLNPYNVEVDIPEISLNISDSKIPTSAYMPSYYSAVIFPSSISSIFQKYNYGGKYWCPSPSLSTEDLLESFSVAESVTSTDEDICSTNFIQQDFTMEYNHDFFSSSKTPTNISEQSNPESNYDTLSLAHQVLMNESKSANFDFSFLKSLDLQPTITLGKNDLLNAILSQNLWFRSLPFWKSMTTSFMMSQDVLNFSSYMRKPIRDYLEKILLGESSAVFLSKSPENYLSSINNGHHALNDNPPSQVNFSETLVNFSQPPRVLLKYNEKKLSLDSSAPENWISLCLQPYGESKDFEVFLLSSKSPDVSSKAISFFYDVQLAYENCKLGKLNLSETSINERVMGFSTNINETDNYDDNETTQSDTATSYEQLASVCVNELSGKNVLFFYFLEDDSEKLLKACQHFICVKDSIKRLGDNKFEDKSLRICTIPNSIFDSPNSHTTNSNSFFTKVSLDIYNNDPLLMDGSLKRREPAFLLKKPLLSTLNYQLKDINPRSSALGEYALHVTYTTVEEHLLICNWNDSYGEFETERRYFLQDLEIEEALQQILEVTFTFLNSMHMDWIVIVMKIGEMSDAEYLFWDQAIIPENLQGNVSLTVGYCSAEHGPGSTSKVFSRIPYSVSSTVIRNNSSHEHSLVAFIREMAMPVPNDEFKKISTILARGYLALDEDESYLPLLSIHLLISRNHDPYLMLNLILKHYLSMIYLQFRTYVSFSSLPLHISTVLYQKQLLQFMASDITHPVTS